MPDKSSIKIQPWKAMSSWEAASNSTIHGVPAGQLLTQAGDAVSKPSDRVAPKGEEVKNGVKN
jgi:hypothetical protein